MPTATQSSMLLPLQGHTESSVAVSATTNMWEATPRKRKRVKTGCLTCRARKVKCDETHPLCNNCSNLNVQCRWSDGSQGSQDNPADSSLGPNVSAAKAATKSPSLRSPACFTCRYARSKCSKTRPLCTRCVLYDQECRYPQAKGNRPLTSSAHSWMQRFQSRESGSPNTQTREENTAFSRGVDTELPVESHVSPPHSLLSEQGHHHSDSTNSHASDHVPVYTGPSETYAGSNMLVTSNFPAPPIPSHSQAHSNAINGRNASSRPLNAELPTQDQAERLAVAFFLRVHVYRANAFLHREKTLHAIRDGSLSRTVVLALCAVGARFASPPEIDDRAKEWATEAGNRVISSTEALKENIVTSLLLTIYTQQAGRFSQSHLWSAIANNQAISLGLHREAATGTRSFLESERDRRLFYACYTINRFISNGTPESIQCPASRIKLRLPCDGFNYRMDVSIETPYAVLEDDDSHIPQWMYRNVGAMGFWVRLVGVRAMIKRYFHFLMDMRDGVRNQDGMQDENTDTLSCASPWIQTSLFVTCMTKLASLRESLPTRFQLTRDLILRRYDSPALGQIVMFYLWWNECHIELCSIVLLGYPQSLDEGFLSMAPEGWVDQTRETCLRHAQAITEILALVTRELNGQPLTIYDHTIAHVVYLSIRVQLELVVPHIGDEIARGKLQDRFETMLGFLERTSTFFHSVHLVLKEMRRMLQNHNMSSQTYQEIESRPETPPLPWFRRQKSLDSKRFNQKGSIEAANLEAMLLELLPDCSSYTAPYWNRDYPVEGLYSNIPPHNVGWDTNPAAGIGSNINGGGNPLVNTTELNALNILDTWGRMEPESEIRFDPLLPRAILPTSMGHSSEIRVNHAGSFSYDPLDP